MKTIDRRTALTLLGGAIGGAAASGISTATADSHVNPGSYPDPNTVDGLYNIHRKLQFSFDDRLVYWYLRMMRYGLVNSAFTPLWDIHTAFLAVTENTKDGFQARMMSATFYTDIKSGRLLKEFDNPYTGERVSVRQPGLNRFSRDYNQLGLVTPLPKAVVAERLGMPMTQFGNVGPAWIIGDDIWCRGDTGLRAEPTKTQRNIVQVNDWSTFHGSISEVANPNVTSANATQTFNDINTWPDWLNMADHPGNYVSRGFGRKSWSIDGMPQEWRAIMRDQYPRELADPRAYILGAT